MKCYVYALIDPNTQKMVYIGSTKNPKRRLYDYRNGPLCGPVADWAFSLNNREDIQMKIIEETTHDERYDREYFWIQKMLSEKKRLLNKKIKNNTGANKKTGRSANSVGLKSKMPKVMQSSKENINIVLDNDLVEWIDKLCADALKKGVKVSRNSAINQIIRGAMEAEKGE